MPGLERCISLVEDGLAVRADSLKPPRCNPGLAANLDRGIRKERAEQEIELADLSRRNRLAGRNLQNPPPNARRVGHSGETEQANSRLCGRPRQAHQSRINAVAIMGGDEIDLREAEIEGGEMVGREGGDHRQVGQHRFEREDGFDAFTGGEHVGSATEADAIAEKMAERAARVTGEIQQSVVPILAASR